MNWFSRVAAEVDAATNRVAMADLSVFSKFKVSGPGTAAFFDTLGANRPPKPGSIGLTHCLTPAGGVLSEFTVARLGAEHAYLTSAAAAEEIDFDLLSAHAKAHDVALTNVAEDVAVIALMGPKAPVVMAGLGADALIVSPWLSCQKATICGVKTRALRVSYIGEAGWEFHVPTTNAPALFARIEAAAKPHGLGYYGAYAPNSMRLENGYRGWGADLTTERSPIEAGLGAFVRDKDKLPAAWDMVLLDIETDEVDPFYAHTVWQGGRAVGVVNSGAYGHRTQKPLALAYLRDPAAREDLTVSILGKRRRATILPEAPFDPENNCPRLKGDLA